jgi:hypothetical protein
LDLLGFFVPSDHLLDEFSPHPLHISSTPQYSNFSLEKNFGTRFLEFSNSNLGKTSENTFRNLFSRQKKLQKMHFEVFFKGKIGKHGSRKDM